MNKHSVSLLLIHNSTCYGSSAGLGAQAALCTLQTTWNKAWQEEEGRAATLPHGALDCNLSQQPGGRPGLTSTSWIMVFLFGTFVEPEYSTRHRIILQIRDVMLFFFFFSTQDKGRGPEAATKCFLKVRMESANTCSSSKPMQSPHRPAGVL